ncbi:MAG TPA: hypothetical protein VMT24_09465, partial [Aggregatilineaceae bacterium]|nr:hypothetical protein [Aggregatilineaceae bacterium]
QFYAPADEYDAVPAIVADILAQLPVQPAAGEPTECYASTDTTGVPMRLGPGLIRGEYTSLAPQGGRVLVIGQATVKDGSLWWRVGSDSLDVKELWVANMDVNTSGTCSSVGQVNAPPVFPPAPGYVPQARAPSGGDETGAAEGGGRAGTPPTQAWSRARGRGTCLGPPNSS